MSPDLPTIDEDLQRAEAILESGRGNGTGGTIYGADTQTAYQLLARLTRYIRFQRQERETMLETIVTLNGQYEAAVSTNRLAAEQIAAAVTIQQEYTRRLAALPPPPQRLGPLRPDHPAVYTVCPGCQMAIQPGDYVTHVAIGPGDDADTRMKAAAGLPYVAVTIRAHWACVTGQETRG
jgi:hypothetical protein